MDAFSPGRVTLVFDASESLSNRLTVRTGKIGVRLAGHPVAAALLKQVGSPVTGTSANLSGRPGCRQVQYLDAPIAKQVDLILDAGMLKGGAGSTIVDVTIDPPRILRRTDCGRRIIAHFSRNLEVDSKPQIRFKGKASCGLKAERTR